jgi:hypothetical protein
MLRVAFFCMSLAALAGCVTPSGCASQARNELRTVERLIADTRENLARGYTYQSSYSGWTSFCLGGGGDNVGIGFCTDGSRRQAVPIDRASEERTLASLTERRDALSAQVAAEEAACAASGS